MSNTEKGAGLVVSNLEEDLREDYEQLQQQQFQQQYQQDRRDLPNLNAPPTDTDLSATQNETTKNNDDDGF